MRKITVIICAAILALSFASCTSKTDGNTASGGGKSAASDNQAVKAKGRDMTVDIKPLKVTDKQIKHSEGYGSEGQHAIYIDDIKSLMSESIHVIRCTALNSSFVTKGGCAYTKFDVRVDKCYKGKFAEGDKITVIMDGGYICTYDYVEHYDLWHRYNVKDRNELKDKITEMRPENNEDYPKAGDEFIIGLFDESFGRRLPFKDCYYPASGANGTYKKDKNGKFTSSYNLLNETKQYSLKNTGESFTLEYFEEHVKKYMK